MVNDEKANGHAEGEKEAAVIENVVSQWYIQGGEMEFGEIGEPQNADELISAIMTTVRMANARKAAPIPTEGITGSTSDGYHTFDELYAYRKVFNALLFNQWAALGLYDVHKAWKHSDGEPCFGGGWFIVVAQIPQGQISNHYKAEDWDLFSVPVRQRSAEYDGHTPAIALERMMALATAAPLPAGTTTEVEKLQKRVEIAERAYDRLNLCPDHRDKANGLCICCQVEKNIAEDPDRYKGFKQRILAQAAAPYGTPTEADDELKTLADVGISDEHGRLRWVFRPKQIEVASSGGTRRTRLLGLLNQTRYVIDEQARRIECLEAELKAAAPQGWQTIETAPKDGTVIRLKWEGTTVEARGRWARGKVIYRSSEHEIRDPDDWRDVLDDGVLHSPTHWLPDPPQEPQ